MKHLPKRACDHLIKHALEHFRVNEKVSRWKGKVEQLLIIKRGLDRKDGEGR